MFRLLTYVALSFPKQQDVIGIDNSRMDGQVDVTLSFNETFRIKPRKPENTTYFSSPLHTPYHSYKSQLLIPTPKSNKSLPIPAIQSKIQYATSQRWDHHPAAPSTHPPRHQTADPNTPTRYSRAGQSNSRSRHMIRFVQLGVCSRVGVCGIADASVILGKSRGWAWKGGCAVGARGE
jgi:hypothetical protein